MLAIMPLAIAFGVALFFAYPEYIEPDYAPSISAELIEDLVSLLISSVVFLLLNGYLLATRGQTLGKAVVGTQIVSHDNRLVPLTRLFLLRYFVIWVICSLPVIGWPLIFADALAIFRENHQCLHDDLCQTKVVSLQ